MKTETQEKFVFCAIGFLAIFWLLGYALPAMAQEIDQSQVKVSTGNSYNAGSGNVKATAKQQQQQAQQQGQSVVVNVAPAADSLGAFATSGTPLATSETNIEFNQPDDITLRNTASAGTPSVYPSGNCYMGWSAGLGLPGFNASAGKATLDDNCDARETARMFYQFGERTKAIMILCMQPAAQMLEGCSPAQDYNAEMRALKEKNELLFEDNTEMAQKVESYCKQSSSRSFAACVEK